MPIELVDPTVSPIPYDYGIADRDAGSGALVIGLVSNGKPNAEELLTGVAEHIGPMLGRDVQAQVVTKPHASRVMPPEQVDLIARKCNFAIIGVGD